MVENHESMLIPLLMAPRSLVQLTSFWLWKPACLMCNQHCSSLSFHPAKPYHLDVGVALHSSWFEHQTHCKSKQIQRITCEDETHDYKHFVREQPVWIMKDLFKYWKAGEICGLVVGFICYLCSVENRHINAQHKKKESFLSVFDIRWN